MGQQVKVDRELVFQGVANYSQNIEGNPFPKRVNYLEHFIIPQAYAGFTEGEANGGTIAWAAPHTLTLTTGGVDDDNAELTHPSTWTGSRNAMIQAKVKVDVITTVALNIGFVAAAMATNDQIGFEITAAAATLVNARASDGACFVFDTDGTPDYWYMCATKAAAEGTPIVLSVRGSSKAPVAATYAWFGVKLDTSGNVTYYYNFEPVGYQAAAVTAATAQLPYVAIQARAGAVRVATVDALYCWQDEA